jgi:tetraacyldisaccharide 4'-kinase
VTIEAARPWLAPLTPLYRLALGLRELELRRGWRRVERLRWPVISIGNLSAGGAGKTPLTIALARALGGRGIYVDVLSRGYGRTSHAAMRVNTNGTAEEYGDEPLEIARAAGVPVFVAARRYEAGLMAETEMPVGVHLLDDGFQHWQLYREVDIVLVSARDFEDRLLPAGNLREPLRALQRADCVVISADDEQVETELKRMGWQGQVWRVRRRMEVLHVNGPVVAFCGIARPEQFFAGLEAGGMQLAARIAYADHHRYSVDDVERLREEMRKRGAVACVTTEKDRVRLSGMAQTLAKALALKVASLRVEIEDEDAAVGWLLGRIKR